MAVRDNFAPGEILAAGDLNDTFASKADDIDAIITAGSASATPLTVRGISGQTGNLLTLDKTAGTTVYSIGANGNSLQVSTASASVPMVIRGASGQTADLVQLQNSASTNRFLFDSSGTPKVIGTTANSVPARLQMNGKATNDGFYHREIFAISGVTAATEITRLTSTGANGYRAYFKINVHGHSGGVGNGSNIKEFYWDGATNAPVQISTYTQGQVPPITFDNSTSQVCIVNLASANAVASFNGVMAVEWLIPVDFSGNTGVIS